MLAKILATSSGRVAQVYINDIKAQLPKLARWGLPAVIGGGWFIYPAISPNFKKDFGLPL